MQKEPSSPIVWIFIGVWIALIVASFVFSRMASPSLQRKLRVPSAIGVGVLLLFFAWLMDGINAVMFLLIPVVLIMAINIVSTRICENCGQVTYNPYLMPPRFCQKCGAKLGRFI